MKKYISPPVIAIALMTILSTVFAGSLHDETSTFKVYGNCETCKKNIETALKKNPNIKSADWNVQTKMITVVFNPHAVTLDQIHKIIAEAGYDTDKVKASDTAYNNLPKCCKYQRKK